jgi:hypothetical protein
VRSVDLWNYRLKYMQEDGRFGYTSCGPWVAAQQVFVYWSSEPSMRTLAVVCGGSELMGWAW